MNHQLAKFFSFLCYSLYARMRYFYIHNLRLLDPWLIWSRFLLNSKIKEDRAVNKITKRFRYIVFSWFVLLIVLTDTRGYKFRIRSLMVQLIESIRNLLLTSNIHHCCCCCLFNNKQWWLCCGLVVSGLIKHGGQLTSQFLYHPSISDSVVVLVMVWFRI